MNKVIVEFHNKPKCMFEDAEVHIMHKDIFAVICKSENGISKTHLYPFNSVLCITCEGCEEITFSK